MRPVVGTVAVAVAGPRYYLRRNAVVAPWWERITASEYVERLALMDSAPALFELAAVKMVEDQTKTPRSQ